MIKYQFTNDMRPDTLHKSLKESAEYFEKGTNKDDKSTQNVANTMKMYFGLDTGKPNTKIILNEDYDVVIAEAVKKFQFPYPRKSGAIEEQEKYHLRIAPMRDLVKILYFKYVANIGRENVDASVSMEQFKDYMLADETYATGQKDIHDVFYGMQEGKALFSYKNNVTVDGSDRMPNCLFKIVSKMPWVKESNTKNNKSLVLDFSEAKNDEKFWDIVNYNDYWQPGDEKKYNDQKANYIDYLQVGQTKDSINTFKGGHNIIYYGAPGTGKSYRVSEKIKHEYITDYSSQKGHPDVFRATLHPEYSYSDFVGQLLPKVENDRVTYKFASGVFTSALKHAMHHKSRPTFLILEEMSRANVAAVFGDIFQLLDRNEEGRSEYTINNGLIAQNAIMDAEDIESDKDPNEYSVYLPENLFIVGTVNTSDQNVFAMDTAFKRRFTWEYVSPVVDEEGFDNNPDIKISDDVTVNWYTLYMTLNDFITRELGLTEDKQIGPYFIKFGNSTMKPEELIKDKLLQYLWEDVDTVARRMNGGARSLFNSRIASFADLYDSFGKESVFSNKFIEKLQGNAADDTDESDDADGRAED